MTIETKDWVAQQDYMPASASFRVYGTVVVAHPGVEPTLAIREAQNDPATLVLELKLKTRDGSFIQVLTEKHVEAMMPGDHGHIERVEIFHGDTLTTTITEVMVSH